MSTIVATATPPGRGGVAIVRVSGPQAVEMALQLTHRSALIPRTAHFTCFYALDNVILDQGIVLYFQAPHSFTGEDVVEFQCHGSPVVLDLIINTLLQCGAVLAKPGEFSLRAYLNDKIDLIQAEAIADLIHAESTTAARMAMNSLQGDFSKRVALLNEQLIYLRLYVEAALDFPDEEIDFLSDGKVSGHLATIQQDLAEISQLAVQGSIMREGITIVIAGRPNAGKSTLLNCLAQRDVAIVTDIPGTTRDVMREHILLDDIPLHIIDTAGLRVSDDVVEQEGIKRAHIAIKNADCVLLVMDCCAEEEYDALIKEIKSTIYDQIPIILVYNKIDKLALDPKKEDLTVYLSLKNNEGLPFLKAAIKDAVGYQPQEGQFLARRRHLDAINQALSLLQQGAIALNNHRSGELLAEDLRLAHLALGEITGEFGSDDLLGKIFSNFCIGK